MKFKKLVDDVELPEKSSPELYINVRSAERVDIRKDEYRQVRTGVSMLVNKSEVARVVGANVQTTLLKTGTKYEELVVTMFNQGERNIMVYPGMVIAKIKVENAKAESSVAKRATIKSTAEFKPAPSDVISNAPGLHRKKDCKGC